MPFENHSVHITAKITQSEFLQSVHCVTLSTLKSSCIYVLICLGAELHFDPLRLSLVNKLVSLFIYDEFPPLSFEHHCKLQTVRCTSPGGHWELNGGKESERLQIKKMYEVKGTSACRRYKNNSKLVIVVWQLICQLTNTVSMLKHQWQLGNTDHGGN